MYDPEEANPFLGDAGQSAPPEVYLRRARTSAYSLGGLALLGAIALAVKFPTWLWTLPGVCGLATVVLAATTRRTASPPQLMVRVLLCAVLGIGGLALLLVPLKLR